METGVTFRRGDYSPLVLAYLGDSFFETLAREYLVGDGNCKPSELNTRAKEIVTAHSQSAMVERLLPLLNDEELAIYKSGEVGSYIRLLAALMPVMYMDTVTDGMLRGLGQQLHVMRYNIIDYKWT